MPDQEFSERMIATLNRVAAKEKELQEIADMWACIDLLYAVCVRLTRPQFGSEFYWKELNPCLQAVEEIKAKYGK